MGMKNFDKGNIEVANSFFLKETLWNDKKLEQVKADLLAFN